MPHKIEVTDTHTHTHTWFIVFDSFELIYAYISIHVYKYLFINKYIYIYIYIYIKVYIYKNKYLSTYIKIVKLSVINVFNNFHYLLLFLLYLTIGWCVYIYIYKFLYSCTGLHLSTFDLSSLFLNDCSLSSSSCPASTDFPDFLFPSVGLIGWLFGLFYGVLTLFRSFNAKLSFKQFSLV